MNQTTRPDSLSALEDPSLPPMGDNSKEHTMKTKFKMIEDAKRQARLCFVGIGIPHQPKLADGTYGPIRSEKILKFNRSALKGCSKAKVGRANGRHNGGDDLMILPVGKPGSAERVAALADQYAAIVSCGEEVSPFRD